MSLPGDDKPDDEELSLFRDALRGVRPLRPRAAPPRPPKARARARFTRADRAAVLEESLNAPETDPHLASGEELSFRRPQISQTVLRKLRRGDYRVQREIDLHGLTVAEAKHALREFLSKALEQRVRCIRIIHGKGQHSGHRGPVLKSAVAGVLHRSGSVLAYVSARQADGGTGAVYVLLESS